MYHILNIREYMYHISIYYNEFIHAVIIQTENIHNLPECQIRHDMPNHIPILSGFSIYN